MERTAFTISERLEKLAQLKLQDEQQQNSKKNKNFTQVYDAGWQRIDELIAKYPLAARIYSYLARICDKQAGVVITQELLAKEMAVTSRSIRSATKWLDEEGIIPRLKVGGNIYLYCLNPSEIWKSWDSSKPYALFNTITIIDKDLNAEIITKLKLIYKF